MLKQILKLPNVRPINMLETPNIAKEKKEVVMNLYLSGIGEEFIAMQLDLEIPVVISILKELDVYRGEDSTEEV